MQHSSDNSYHSDICLLLRAHGEHFWLTTQVLPALRQLELAGSLREDRREGERATALAYLEVLWLDARCRAAATDAALAELLSTPGAVANGLSGNGASSNGASANGANPGADYVAAQARRYHAAVCALRMSIGARVRGLMDAPCDGHAHERAAL
jgi:hypothetical protein